MRWGSWVSAGRKGTATGGKGARRGSSAKERFQSFVRPRGVDAKCCGFLPRGIFSPCGGGSGGLGSGVPGRVSPPGTHVLLILGVERVHHIRRGLGIVAALLEALHRVRLGLLHGHLPSRLCTAVVDDGGAARVSPARVGAVRRGCARVSPLGRDDGLLLELRTVVDCFRSVRWGRAGVRSGRRVRRAWGEKRTLDACNTTPGRLRGRSARVEERRDRNWVPETIGASSTWPEDHARIGIASVEASQSRARAPPSRRVGRRNHESGSKRRLHAPARFR